MAQKFNIFAGWQNQEPSGLRIISGPDRFSLVSAILNEGKIHFQCIVPSHTEPMKLESEDLSSLQVASKKRGEQSFWFEGTFLLLPVAKIVKAQGFYSFKNGRNGWFKILSEMHPIKEIFIPFSGF